VTQELIAKRASKLWEENYGSYIDVSKDWEDDWLDEWKMIVKVVLEAQEELK
jgi:hypothetical protein